MKDLSGTPSALSGLRLISLDEYLVLAQPLQRGVECTGRSACHQRQFFRCSPLTIFQCLNKLAAWHAGNDLDPSAVPESLLGSHGLSSAQLIIRISGELALMVKVRLISLARWGDVRNLNDTS